MSALSELKLKLTLIDNVSGNLRKVNNEFAGFAKLGATMAASFLSFESVVSSFADIVKSGIEFNKTMETATVGMSGVLMSMTKVKDRNLQWNEAMLISKDIIKDLNKQALLTAATPQELTQTFSGLLGIGLGAGMNLEQIKSFTVTGVNAVKSMGLEGRQLIQELRDLLQGSISPQKSTLATALGITGADIKKAKNSAEGLFKYLEARMSGFRISAKYFPETFQGATAVLGGAYQMLIAQSVEKPMERVKELIKTAFLGTLNEDQSGFANEILQTCNNIGNVLTGIINQVVEIGNRFSPLAQAAGDFLGSFAVFASQHLNSMVTGFALWKSAQAALQPIAYDLLNVYDQISAKIGEVKADLAETLSLEKAKAALQKELSAGNVNFSALGAPIFSEMKAEAAEALSLKKAQAALAVELQGGSLYDLGLTFAKNKRESTSETIERRYKESRNEQRLFPLDKEGKQPRTKEYIDKEFNELKRALVDFKKELLNIGLSSDETIKTLTKVTEAFPKMGSSAANAKAMMDELTAAFTKAKVQLDEFTAYGTRVTALSTKLQDLGYQEKQIAEIQRRLITTYKESGQTAASELENQILAVGRFSVKLKDLGVQEKELVSIQKQLMTAYQQGGGSAAFETMQQLYKQFAQAKTQLDEFTAYGTKVTALGETLKGLGYNEKQVVEIQKQLLTTYKESGVAAADALQKQIVGIGEFSGRLKTLGVQEKELISIQKQLMAAYKQGGATAVETLMKQIELTAQATVKTNQWRTVIQGLYGWVQRGSGILMGASIAASTLNETFENEIFSKIEYWGSRLGMLAMAFENLWTAIGGKALAIITIAATAISTLTGLKRAEAAEGTYNFADIDGWEDLSEETKANLLKTMQKGTKEELAKKLKSNLTPKFQTTEDLTAKEALKKQTKEANLVKLLDDAKKISAEIGAKMADRTMSNEEQAFASLNKEIATFQARIDTLKQNGQDVTELQEQLNSYITTATAKISEQFDTLKVRWDDVVVHIKDSQTNFTDIINSGYDSMISSFTSFGENLVTEGGSFMERFSDLLTNFANNICNTLLKIYLQGMLTRSIMSWFGGGSSYNTGWLSDSTENSNGWLSIGNYIVGHANGGVAKGWSLVGEQGPELVNFSNPGRVYTNEETRSMLGSGGVNVKVNVINESGTQMTAQQGTTTFDGESYVINVVMNAVATNRNGMRTLLQGAR